MTTDNPKQRMETIYGNLWSTPAEELIAQTEQSLHPRSSDTLLDLAGELGINAAHTVLDAGSGLGIYSCELARRFGCRVVGLELVQGNIEKAETRANGEDVTERVTFRQGSVEAMPFEDATFDFIWCRDMLVHVSELQQCFSECARVLKPNSTMLIHNTFATDLLEPREAAYLYQQWAIMPANTSPAYFEAAFTNAGFHMLSREVIGSEWIEASEERDGRHAQELMRIARMRRERERLITEFGQVTYDITLAVYYWHIYLLLGKLSSIIYTLRKR